MHYLESHKGHEWWTCQLDSVVMEVTGSQNLTGLKSEMIWIQIWPKRTYEKVRIFFFFKLQTGAPEAICPVLLLVPLCTVVFIGARGDNDMLIKEPSEKPQASALSWCATSWRLKLPVLTVFRKNFTRFVGCKHGSSCFLLGSRWNGIKMQAQYYIFCFGGNLL